VVPKAERPGASGPARSEDREGGETVNIVSLVMSVIDPIRRTWNRRDEVGASLVEYALLLALIAVIALVALHFLGGSVSNTLNNVGSSISNP
jgi:Flp pilus assembly pilin Flp